MTSASRLEADSNGEILELRRKVRDLELAGREHRQMDKGLRKRHDALKTFLKIAPVGMGLVTNNKLSWTNEMLSCMTRYSSKELLGQSAGILYESEEEFRRVLKVGFGDSQGMVETRFRCKDGSLLEVLVHTACLITGDPSAGHAFTALDMTDQRRIDQMKTDFVTTAAHQFRSPLTSIRGYSELLLARDDLPSDEQRECLNHIKNQAEKLTGIVNDLLDVSKFESRKGHSVSSSVCNLTDVIGELIALHEEISEKHQFSRELPDTPIEIAADKTRIKQLFANILDNAVNYSPEGGSIVIKGDSRDNGFVFSVEDQGIGMTSEQVERIFDKFYRADASNNAVSSTGLGMTIAKEIVEDLGGKISVDSTYGQGTTVRFSLPMGLLTVAHAERGGGLIEEDTDSR